MNETYIKMCKEAREIQEAWQPQPGDWFADKWNNKEFLAKLTEKTILGDGRQTKTFWSHDDIWSIQKGRTIAESNITWLPRQEDLQNIAFEPTNNDTTTGLHYDFDKYIHKRLKKAKREHQLLKLVETSFNELWLCFVMETCYNKTWNGNTWELIGD